MGQILKFIRPGSSFGPDITETLISAYEKAVTKIASDQHALLVQRMIAKKISEIAKQGETDSDRLCEAALTTVGFPPTTEMEDVG